MASGQYTCKKCGAGETKSALSSADHIAVQNTISSLHDCWSTGYRVEQGQVERVKEKLAKALSFFNGDTERSKVCACVCVCVYCVFVYCVRVYGVRVCWKIFVLIIGTLVCK